MFHIQSPWKWRINYQVNYGNELALMNPEVAAVPVKIKFGLTRLLYMSYECMCSFEWLGLYLFLHLNYRERLDVWHNSWACKGSKSPVSMGTGLTKLWIDQLAFQSTFTESKTLCIDRMWSDIIFLVNVDLACRLTKCRLTNCRLTKCRLTNVYIPKLVPN